MLTALVHVAPALENHLWQSTAFVAVAWLLAFALRKNQARTRYWIWFAASMKFLLPFSVLFAIGSYLRPVHIVMIAPAPVSAAVQQMAQPFSNYVPASVFAAPVDAHDSNIPLALMLIWAFGFLVVSVSWWRRWRRVQKACSTATPGSTVIPGCVPSNISVRISESLIEPGVFGIFRPVLMLPTGIADRLTLAQMNAILAHEMSHIRRRDNLTAALHMIVAAVFWFHPIVWWIGARLVEERENACDEEVMRLGGEPETYAEGILEICKFYMESPVVCVSGVSGADLKKRIVRIMSLRFAKKLTIGAKLLLASVAIAVIAVPLAYGAIAAPQSGAFKRIRMLYLRQSGPSYGGQSAPVVLPIDDGKPLPSFEVASIKAANPSEVNSGFSSVDPSQLRVVNMTANGIIRYVYGLKDFQLAGGPDWANSKKYDINAKVEDSIAKVMQGMSRPERQQQVRMMLDSLLIERFKLSVSHTTKEEPEYALVVAKGGPKLTPTAWVPPPDAPGAQDRPKNGSHLLLDNGTISAINQTVSGLTDLLAFMPEMGGHLVVDHTGITGNYDYTVKFSSEALGQKFAREFGAPPPNLDDSGSSIFTALEEQLGLKLEMTKGPVDIYTIEHIEEPSEN